MIPTKQQNPSGLHQRYRVTKLDQGDESESDRDAVYFVLRLDGNGDDNEHIQACRIAARVYALAARLVPHLKQIGDDLVLLVQELERK